LSTLGIKKKFLSAERKIVCHVVDLYIALWPIKLFYSFILPVPEHFMIIFNYSPEKETIFSRLKMLAGTGRVRCRKR
jgi:hypothetical protein